MEFTAIDFETANASRTSACAVGICVVRNGQVTECLQRLIRPEPLEFAPMNIAIHGITPADVIDAPAFAEVWQEIRQMVRGPLIAHNASFDMSVIRRSLEYAGLPCPDWAYYCTLTLAKRIWPDLPTYRLDDLARFLDVPLRHHDAAEDARACAMIALEACRCRGVDTLVQLEKACGIAAGCLEYMRADGGSCKTSYRRWPPSVKASEIMATNTPVDTAHPLFGKRCVFSGSLASMTRREAMQSVVDCGGICTDTVRRDTDYLVLGQDGYTGYPAGYKSSKTRRAEQMAAEGHRIAILSEAEFLTLLRCR